MPASIVKSFADKTGKSVPEVEKLWNKAKALARKDGRKESDDDFFPYVTGILKKMLKIDEELDEVTVKPKYKVGSVLKYYSDKSQKTLMGKVASVELDGKDIIYGLETGGFVRQSDLVKLKESYVPLFKDFVNEELTEAIAVDTERFEGVHGKKPKGHGQWIFFTDKNKTDIRKDDHYQTKTAMNYSDAVKAAKKWAKEKNLYRIYVAS